MATPGRASRGSPPANYTPAPRSNPRYQPAPTDDFVPQPPAPGDHYDGDQKLANVNTRVNDVKASLQKNIELAITRGEKLDDLDVRTEQLAEDANTFQTNAKRVRRMFWKRYWKMMIVIGLCVAIVVAIIIIIATQK